MKGRWTVTTLGNCCQLKPPKKEARERLASNELISFVPMHDLGICKKDLKATEDRPLESVSGSYTYFAEGDVLLAKITPCFENGKLGIARGLTNGVGFGSSEFIVFRPSASLDAEYLFYFLSQDSFREAGASVMSGAVGHKRLPNDFIENYLIPLPQLCEQKRIITILDEAFAGIDAAIANTERNLANASELFESYVNSVFKNRSAEWAMCDKPLSELCELIVDCEHKTAPNQNEGFPSIRTPNIGKGKLLLDGVYRVSQETYNEWTRRAEPRSGDLILAREAPAGNVAVIPDNLKVCLGQRTVLIRPNQNLFISDFLALFLLQPQMQKKLLAHSRGATVQHVNMKDIRALIVDAIPSLGVQREIVGAVSNVSAQIGNLESIYQQKLTALAELKQSLLQKAFSGELTSKFVEEATEAAA